MKHIKIVVTLTLVVLLASILVFYVEAWTTPIIDDYNFEQANLAKFEVLPSLEGSDSLEADLSYDFTGTSITELIVIPGKGYIYTAEFQGFQSIVTYMIGIDTNGTITGYKTLIQGDTPGLGAEIAKDWYKDQFPGTSINDLSGIDGWTGATITFGGSRASLSKVMDFHNSTFEGVVLETPAERLARWKKEITVDNAVITDVSGDYTLTGGVTKVELANDGVADVAVIYTAEFTGYVGTVEYIIALDLETNDVIGLRIVSNGETAGIGSILSDESFQTQFETMLQIDALNGNIDEVAGSSAPITYGEFKSSLAELINFHKSAFEGEVIETFEEKIARWKKEITVDNAVITDVSADYTLSDGVIKVEIANDGVADVAVIYTVEFIGYNPSETVEYLIAFDLVTNDITGFRVVYQSETPGLGAKIAEESYFVQFDNLLQADALAGNIDGLAGASITTGGLKTSLVKVVNFHKVEFEGIVIETPDPVETSDANLLKAFPGAATFNSIYAEYTYIEDILNIYEVKDGTDEVIGYVYYAQAKGFGVNNIEFAWGVDVYGVTVEIAILNDTQSWASAEEYADYNGSAGDNFNTSPWLNNFEGVTLQSLINTTIDVVAGVSTTTGGMVNVTKTIAEYHIDGFELLIPDEGPIFETTTDANLLLALPGAVTFTSVYSDFTLNEGILNIYEAKDGSDAVVGYVYFAHVAGFGANNIQFVIGVDNLNNTVLIEILNDTQSWDMAQEYADYDGSAGLDFATSPWLESFEGVTLQSLLDTPVDDVAGVSTTTGGMISIIETIAQYHATESVGGGN